MVFVSPDIATVRIFVDIRSIHSTKISVNFDLKKQSYFMRIRAQQLLFEWYCPTGVGGSRASHARSARLRPTSMRAFRASHALAFAVLFLTAGLGLKDIHIKEKRGKGPEIDFFFKRIILTTFRCHSVWHKPPDHRVMQHKVYATFLSCFFFFFPLNGKRIQSELTNLTCSRCERGSSQLEHLLVFVLEYCWPN